MWISKDRLAKEKHSNRPSSVGTVFLMEEDHSLCEEQEKLFRKRVNVKGRKWRRQRQHEVKNEPARLYWFRAPSSSRNFVEEKRLVTHVSVKSLSKKYTY